MNIYLTKTVYEAALERIRWTYRQFGNNVAVAFSGGKDSTVCLHLTYTVAKELGRLPVPVVFVDQEAEWQATVDYVRQVMSLPWVQPYWLQIPIKLANSTQTADPWLHCWEPGVEWIRAQEPDAITRNVYGTDRFYEVFKEFLAHHYPGQPAALIGGVRTEESPARKMAMTSYETYRGETWGRVQTKRHDQYTMYPIYDWSYTDVWHCIEEQRLRYCRLYDRMYQHGIPVNQMRVSNVHHETATHVLKFLQEIEPDTWSRLTKRLRGLNTVCQMQDSFYTPTDLPPMFADWREYRDHLLNNLITNPEHVASFRKKFDTYDANYDIEAHHRLVMVQIASILVNDFEGSKLDTFRASHAHLSKGAGTRGGAATARIREQMQRNNANPPTR